MTYPESFTQKIGFDQIVEFLQKECITAGAAEIASRISPIREFEKLKVYLEQTSEFKQLMMLERSFPSQDYYDLSSQLRRLRVEGSYITLEGLQQLRASYSTLNEIKKYFNNLDAEVYPRLCEFSVRLQIHSGILPQIDTILTRTGEVRDSASENLLRIRSLIRKKSSETHRYIGKYMDLARQQGWVEEDSDVTVRNERLVIPVTAAHKKSMRGFIHDVSSTGQTVFMEPEEIFNLNNEIVELRNEERLEIIEILKRFTSYIRPDLDVLLQAYRFLVSIDFLRAKAKLALLLEAGMPVLEKYPCIEWKQARHPLLFLTLKKKNGGERQQEIVPLDIKLEEKEKIIIISGPNAGGKSVCLKTVGLLQYMMQCGLLVPMREDSRMGVYRNIFVDIGDEQSIENDLSTYSSHLKNMKFWVEHADRQTLFLSDELGSGTEPQVGGAIAESIIEELLRKGATGIVTTHYTNLKLMARNHSGVVNGAMLFDQENLRPLYVFRKGLPGSSFAFEIARKIGLPERVLESASRKVGRRQMSFEEELQRIEVEKHAVSKKKLEVELADQLLSSTLEKYTDLLSELEEKRAQLLRDAKAEAQDLVRRANAEIEKTIRLIREAQAEKEETSRLRSRLQDLSSQGFSNGDNELKKRAEPGAFWKSVMEKHGTSDSLSGSSLPDHRKIGKEECQRKNTSLEREEEYSLSVKVGSLVRLDNQGMVGIVTEMKGTKAKVDFEFITMQVSIEKLHRLTPSQEKDYRDSRKVSSVKIQGINEGKVAFSPHVDLRGMRADEAQDCIQKLLDDAVLYGEKYLEILHGKGDGVLRQVVRACISKHPEVASFSDQVEELGGFGITIVVMR